MKFNLLVEEAFVFLSIFLFGFGQNQKYVTNDDHCPLNTTDIVKCNETNIYYESECDESICDTDSMCIEYHRIASKLNYCRRNESIELRDYAIRNVTQFSNNPTSTTIIYTTGGFNDYVYGDDCLNNDNFIDQINNETHLTNSSSFSPWEYIINIDENRIPREILETKCRCRCCLNSERTRPTEIYFSLPLMVTRYFHLKGSGNTVFNAEFSYGCVCQHDPKA